MIIRPFLTFQFNGKTIKVANHPQTLVDAAKCFDMAFIGMLCYEHEDIVKKWLDFRNGEALQILLEKFQDNIHRAVPSRSYKIQIKDLLPQQSTNADLGDVIEFCDYETEVMNLLLTYSAEMIGKIGRNRWHYVYGHVLLPTHLDVILGRNKEMIFGRNENCYAPLVSFFSHPVVVENTTWLERCSKVVNRPQWIRRAFISAENITPEFMVLSSLIGVLWYFFFLPKERIIEKFFILQFGFLLFHRLVHAGYREIFPEFIDGFANSGVHVPEFIIALTKRNITTDIKSFLSFIKLMLEADVRANVLIIGLGFLTYFLAFLASSAVSSVMKQYAEDITQSQTSFEEVTDTCVQNNMCPLI